MILGQPLSMLPVLSAPLHKITVPFNVIQEPYNLKGVHSFRYNGLIKKKAIDLQSASDGKGVTFRYKKSKGINRLLCFCRGHS